MSPKSVPSGRFSTALHDPAMRTEIDTSSTRLTVETLWGMVISAPRILVSLNTALKVEG